MNRRKSRAAVLIGFLVVAIVGVLWADSVASFIVKDHATINPYTPVTKTYAGPIRKIEIYNPGNLNYAVVVNQGNAGDKAITDHSAIIVTSTETGVIFDNLTLQGTTTVLLQGYTAVDTGTVPILIYK